MLLLAHDRPTGALLVDQLDERRFVVVLEHFRLEVPRLLVDDVLGEIEHILGDFDVLDLVKIFLLGTDFTDFVRIAQQRADQPLAPQFARLYLKVRSLRAGGKAVVVNDVARKRRYAARLLRHTLRMSTPQEDSHSLLTQRRFGSLSHSATTPVGPSGGRASYTGRPVSNVACMIWTACFSQLRP